MRTPVRDSSLESHSTAPEGLKFDHLRVMARKLLGRRELIEFSPKNLFFARRKSGDRSALLTEVSGGGHPFGTWEPLD